MPGLGRENIMEMIYLGAALLVGSVVAGFPRYRVYVARLKGQAALAEAEAESKVTVRQALADEEAAHHLARAEIIRAEGVAKAIEIIGHGLKDNQGYLRYLFIEKLDNQEAQIIYIPTEAGLPILEAGRVAQKAS